MDLGDNMKKYRLLLPLFMTGLGCSVISQAEELGQGGGKISFTGYVIEAPCSVEMNSANQEVNFGQISSKELSKDNGTSVKKRLEINLTDCVIEKQSKVHVTFSGALASDNHPEELGTSGNTGTAIVISDSGGNFVKFDGKSNTVDTYLQSGNNTLVYTTWVKKKANSGVTSNSAATIQPGRFNAITAFQLHYD